MRIFFLILSLCLTTLADKDGNGKCWQREKIQELQKITQNKEHIEYGSVIAGKNVDDSDYYYFTPKMSSKFNLIFSSNENVDLHVGTSCSKESSILKGKNDTEFVILDKEIEKTVYIHVIAKSKKLTSYKIHVKVSSKDDNNSKMNYNINYGTHFQCELINENVVCKR